MYAVSTCLPPASSIHTTICMLAEPGLSRTSTVPQGGSAASAVAVEKATLRNKASPAKRIPPL